MLRGIAGTVLGVGVVILLFVAYQVWGTDLQEQRSQDRLRRGFEQSAIVAAPETREVLAPPALTTRSVPATTTTTTPPPALGSPVAVLRIPRLGLDKVVVEGAGTAELQLGPGHYPTTPLPGQAGNVAIAGHRTTYGAPFRDLDALRAGDEIFLRAADRELRYLVSETVVVSPDAVEVLVPRGDDRVTLTTCDPPYSARGRLIVTALLDGPPLTTPASPQPAPEPSAAPRRITPYDEADASPTRVPASGVVVGDRAPSATSWTVAWPGLLTALLAASVWIGVRRTRTWWLLLPGAVPVLASLLLFFERLSLALPPEA